MLDITIAGHHFIAHPERALYWPAQSMLLIADVHLGKADTFRHFGIGVPQQVQTQDLARLQQVLQVFNPQRCMILGDLVHGRTMGPATTQAWNALVDAHASTSFELILGNHDRALQPQSLALHYVRTALNVGDVCLSHEPWPQADWPQCCKLNIHGHIHAAMRIDGSRSKLPALVYAPPYLSMPAFSEFTAGVIPTASSQHIWVFAGPDALVAQLC